MNILLIGGNHKLGICLLDNLLSMKIKFKLIILDNNKKDKKENETIKYYYNYLLGDCLFNYYGSIEDYNLMDEIIDRHNVNYIINNVKYSPKNNFDYNYGIIVNGYYNVLKLGDKYDTVIINIDKLFTQDLYHLKKCNVKKISKFFSNYKCQLDLLLQSNIQTTDRVHYIYVYDNVYYSHDDFEFTNETIDKYIDMFKIQSKPYAYNLSNCFVNNENIMYIINSILNEEYINKQQHLYGITVNIQNELIPTMIECIKNTSVEKNDSKYDYYCENNHEHKIKLLNHEKMIKTINRSIKNIYRLYK